MSLNCCQLLQQCNMVMNMMVMFGDIDDQDVVIASTSWFMSCRSWLTCWISRGRCTIQFRHLEDESYEVFIQRIRFSPCSHHNVKRSFSMERIVRRIEEEELKIITSTTGRRSIGEDEVSVRVTFKNFGNSIRPRECEGNIQGRLGTLKSLPKPRLLPHEDPWS